MKLQPGVLWKERYQILSQIGEGGFAKVFRAVDKQLNREVAIKVLKPSALSSPEDLSRFQREARILAQIRHKNIVSCYAFGLEDDGTTAYLVMEFMSGTSLQSLLAKSGALPSSQIIELLNQICDGLSYAHEAGIVHRDLSPPNIYLEKDGDDFCVKLLDFGLSKVFSARPGQDASLTASGVLMGNPPYMSPEQGKGQKIDARSDIYALGCIIYECLCGKKAFEADSPVRVLFMHHEEYPLEPLEPSGIDTVSSGLLKAITLRCLQKDPEKRFQTCREIQMFLHNEIAGDGFSDVDPWASRAGVTHKDSSKAKSPNAGNPRKYISGRRVFSAVLIILLLIVTGLCCFAMTDNGACAVEEISLHFDSSKSARLKWLRKASEQAASGHLAVAAGMENVLMKTSKSNLDLPELCLDLAKENLHNGDKKAAFHWAMKCLDDINGKSPDTRRDEWRGRYNWLMTESSIVLLNSGQKFSRAQYDHLNRFVISNRAGGTDFRMAYFQAAKDAGIPLNPSIVYEMGSVCFDLANTGRSTELGKVAQETADGMLKVTYGGRKKVVGFWLQTALFLLPHDKARSEVMLDKGLAGLSVFEDNYSVQYEDALKLASELLLKVGRLNEAEKYCRRLIALRSNDQTYDPGPYQDWRSSRYRRLLHIKQILGKILVAEGKTAEATQLARDLIRDGESNGLNSAEDCRVFLDSVLNLGDALAAQGKWEEAIIQLRKQEHVFEQSGSQIVELHAELLQAIADDECKLSRFDEAEHTLREALALGKTNELNPRVKTSIYIQLIRTLLKMSKFEELRKAVNSVQMLPNGTFIEDETVKPWAEIIAQLREKKQLETKKELEKLLMGQANLALSGTPPNLVWVVRISEIMLGSGDLEASRKVLQDGLKSDEITSSDRSWLEEKLATVDKLSRSAK